MPVYQLITLLAVASFIGFGVLGAQGRQPAWQLPALLCLAFTGWTGFAIANDGLVPLWDLFTGSAWGVQVGIDLLLAFATAWGLALPRLRAAGMAPMAWFVLICCTGSIGVMAMLARLLWREQAMPTQLLAGRI